MRTSTAEQFFRIATRLTARHMAKIDENPAAKKSNGVYYTPSTLVDFIVQHTLGRLLQGKTPKEAARLRILDPACGAGAFLIGAYRRLLEWHLKQYEQDGPERRRNQVVQGTGGTWRLTTAEKKRILLNNIYGVDIDPQAVEAAKLSLLAAVHDGEQRNAVEARFLDLVRQQASSCASICRSRSRRV
ncbi:MAG TPA: DNA methyltransferase, partial [Gemmataceae bacterium]|nr:DNA methyltransferase [Gemmataceae bacterium]